MEITRDEDCGVANEGQKFFVLTDNAAVAWLRNFKDPTGRQAVRAYMEEDHRQVPSDVWVCVTALKQ